MLGDSRLSRTKLNMRLPITTDLCDLLNSSGPRVFSNGNSMCASSGFTGECFREKWLGERERERQRQRERERERETEEEKEQKEKQKTKKQRGAERGRQTQTGQTNRPKTVIS